MRGFRPSTRRSTPASRNRAAISRVVMTAPSGYPLPIALATATTSGTTPCCSKPQNHVPEPAVAGLHLVGDREPADLAHRRVHLGEVAVGQRDAAGVAGEGLGDERGRRTCPRGELADAVGGLGRVARGIRAAVAAAERVRRVDHVHPVGPGLEGVRVVGDRGARPRRSRTSTRGRPRHRDDVAPAGRRERDAQREVDGLRARVHEEDGVERRRAASPRDAPRTRRRLRS